MFQNAIAFSFRNLIKASKAEIEDRIVRNNLKFIGYFDFKRMKKSCDQIAKAMILSFNGDPKCYSNQFSLMFSTKRRVSFFGCWKKLSRILRIISLS